MSPEQTKFDPNPSPNPPQFSTTPDDRAEVGNDRPKAAAPSISNFPSQIIGAELQQSRRVHGLPPSGTWFWKQDPMFVAMQKCHGGGFAVAWDKKLRGSENKGAKLFG